MRSQSAVPKARVYVEGSAVRKGGTYRGKRAASAVQSGAAKRRTVRGSAKTGSAKAGSVKKGRKAAGKRTGAVSARSAGKKRRAEERKAQGREFRILSQKQAQIEAEREKERQRILEERELDHQALQERLRSKTVPIDRPFLWILIFASAVTLGLCFHYVQLKMKINAQVSSIEKKEKQLEELRAENGALENSIYSSIDLDEVYRIATEELGMVYADEDQVITFEKTESEYVRQYEKIPKY